MLRKQKGPQVFRITGARQGLEDDVRGRQRRYVISMLIRTLAVLLTVILWNVQRPLAVVTLVLGATLPYVAVVIANAGRERVRDMPPTLVTGPSRPVLGPGATERPDEGTPADGPRGTDRSEEVNGSADGGR
ncbi:DUF3099 domain-containing protein [Streptomyces hazeniae]|uniref:DUF3099 domain-containing protein n=1 Tax=Streptomyces hazeniae TaxID=3075538 RepID=UPI00374E048D